LIFRNYFFNNYKKIPYYPWIYFCIFFLSSIPLSYFQASIAFKIIVFLFGVFLPLFVACRVFSLPSSGTPVFKKKIFFTKPPFFFLFLVLSTGIFFRFYHLDTLSVWPLLDEGRNAFFGWSLSKHWNWRLFYDISQMPPLSYWLLGLYFKIIQPSLLSLWFFPAILSSLLLPLGFFAVRRYFPRNFSLLFFCILALCFYPFYLGRFNHQAVLLVFWELLTFLVLGFLHSSNASSLKKIALLGLCAGIGFYIYFSWPLVALAIVLLVFHQTAGQRKGLLWIFGLVVLIVVSPLLVIAQREGYGSYIHSLWIYQSEISYWEWLHQSFSYITGLFWGLETARHAYKPFWGGYLNPLLTASFFIGLLELFRFRRSPISKALLGMFVFFLLPAFVSKDIEMFRIVQVLPVLLLIVTVGLMVLLSSIPSKKRFAVFIFLIIASAALDFYHLTVPYHKACSSQFERWASYAKSAERWRAYQILKKVSAAQGPGYIFSNFDPYPFDKSLFIATCPFNLEGNSNIKESDTKWVAFLTNVNFRPFLSKRFPKAMLTWLSSDLSTADGGLMLAVIPLKLYPEIFSPWVKANEQLKPASLEMLNRPLNEKRNDILKIISMAYPAFRGDPFLESVYWNLVYLNHSADGQFHDAMLDLNQALTKGYKTSYFYNELGGLLFSKRDYPGARNAFRKAIISKLNQTPAEDNLKYLNQLETRSQP
jgi:hypothetical protein